MSDVNNVNILATLGQVQSIAADLALKVKNKGYAKKSVVDTLIGSDTGKSVRTIANEELAAQLIPKNAQEALDTLQEIAAWIQEHPNEASAINAKLTLGVPNYIAATGKYVSGTTYYTDATGETEVDTSEFDEDTDVSEYFVSNTANKQYATVKAYVEAYVASQISDATMSGSNAISVSSKTISLIIDTANANGLAITSSGLKMGLATANTTVFVAATGTFVTGTKYYTDNTGATEVDTSDFVDGTTDVSSYFVSSTVSGFNGAMSAADKTKLDSIRVATAGEVQAVINSITIAD